MFTAVIDSRSKWFVGWSRSKKFEPKSIIRENIHLDFSPPESTFTGLKIESPEKSILPRKPRRYVSVWSFEYLLIQSRIESLQFAKYSILSLGKYDFEMLTPHLNEPESASVSSIKTLKRAVIAISLPRRAIFSPLATVKETFLNSVIPFSLLDRSVTVKMSLPASLSISKPINGYLRLDAGNSSTVNLSSSFLREVACLDFDLFAEKREIKLCSSLIFSSFFLFCCLIIRWMSWLDSYQNS